MSIARALSDVEILRLANRPIKTADFYLYSELPDRLPQKGHSYLILTRSTPSFGHWTCLIHRPDGMIELFDPYGLPPDVPLTWSRKVNSGLGQTYPHLSNLLRKVPESRLRYNEVALQKPNTETCGHWCVLRHHLRAFDEKAFQQLFTWLSYTTGVSTDDIAATLIQPLV